MSNKRPTMTSTLNEKRNELLKNVASLLTTGAPPGSGLATEATLLTVANTLSQILVEDQLDFELKAVEDANGDIYQLRGVLDEATGTYVWDYIDSSGAVASPVLPVQFVNLSGLLGAIESELVTLNATDFATAANQALAIAELQTLVTQTSDVATETTLAAFLSAFSLTDFATETTLATLATTDFATEATLSGVAADIASLLAAFGTVDFATETTLAAFSAAFAGTDFATQTTLANIDSTLTTIAGIDFATQTTLADVLTELLDQGTTLDNIETELLDQGTTLDDTLDEIEKTVGFALGEYDEIDITYVSAGNGVGEIQTAVYSLGAVVQFTLTFTYDASNRLINITKS